MTPVLQDLPYRDGPIIAPRLGRIVVAGGMLRRIDSLWLPRRFTIWRVWRDSRFRTGSDDTCTLYYRGTRSTPGYLTLDYVRSGPRTTLGSFRRALLALDEIARLRQSVAIFAHVSTTAISDRLLCRWGWEPHAARLGGRHWIKRFYDGYPDYVTCDGRSRDASRLTISNSARLSFRELTLSSPRLCCGFL